MNAREREVMDALAKALRTADSLLDSANIGGGAQENMEALAAYDALLASSAAGEKAEAAAPTTFAWLVEDPRSNYLAGFAETHNGAGFCWMPVFTKDPNAALRFARKKDAELHLSAMHPSQGNAVEHGWMNPQPAQGDCGCYAETRYADGIDDTVTHRCAKHAQGEHEQRSSEGSERRPIAESDVSRACEVFDAATFYSVGGYTFDDYRKRMRAALESALPRGLPARSDAIELRYCEVHKLVLHPNQCYIFTPDETCESCMRLVREHDEGMAQVGYPPPTTFKPDAQRATAEQPSCGQDARDAYILSNLPGSVLRALVGELSDTSDIVEFRSRLDAAIAAQQRQGGAKP